MSAESTPKSEIILYQTDDGSTRLEVTLEAETVWLNQNQMTELFQKTQQNISLHVRNLYDEGELERAATHKEYLSVQQEGSRTVQRRAKSSSRRSHSASGKVVAAASAASSAKIG